jgi:hypothetical protein
LWCSKTFVQKTITLKFKKITATVNFFFAVAFDNMINYKTIFISKTVLVFRFLDLYTTHLATSIDFANQEQNFLVKTLKFNKFSYFVTEVFFAFLLAYFYIKAKRNLPYSKATTFAKFYYLNFSFKMNKFNSFGKLFNIYSLIIPKLYITP